MSTNKVDFGILDYDTEPGLWEKLYNESTHVWETMDDAAVWLNSDDDVLGPVVTYMGTGDFDDDDRQIVKMTLYNRGLKIAEIEAPEPYDWVVGEYLMVRDFAREELDKWNEWIGDA
jgi:hypothetical protein